MIGELTPFTPPSCPAQAGDGVTFEVQRLI